MFTWLRQCSVNLSSSLIYIKAAFLRLENEERKYKALQSITRGTRTLFILGFKMCLGRPGHKRTDETQRWLDPCHHASPRCPAVHLCSDFITAYRRLKCPVHSCGKNVKPTTCLKYFLALQPRTSVLLYFCFWPTVTKTTPTSGINNIFYYYILIFDTYYGQMRYTVQSNASQTPRPSGLSECDLNASWLFVYTHIRVFTSCPRSIWRPNVNRV